jgi:phosphoglycerate kinase
VVGGGDTIEFLNKFSLLKKFDFVSIGGGAMLDFLAGEEMPGLKALGYYGDQKS